MEEIIKIAQYFNLNKWILKIDFNLDDLFNNLVDNNTFQKIILIILFLIIGELGLKIIYINLC